MKLGHVPTRLGVLLDRYRLARNRLHKDRGAADALAAWRRWHDPRQQARFTSDEQRWYSLLERARVETLASQELPGIARNLAQPTATAPANKEMAALYRAARFTFQGLPQPDKILSSSPINQSSKGLLKRTLGQF
ncbi:hypothetical protein HSBAA_63440 [Vreelandella sulfidaeris]|uniref:Uncharacterized protein n=1 Tax=Vreelandella sulfidaeris TaxID=115553 RepID=A0A455UL11_9GAMM|nr:hypothetical protein HSBAA_63440 [Halomonas sulfidaeris]